MCQMFSRQSHKHHADIKPNDVISSYIILAIMNEQLHTAAALAK